MILKHLVRCVTVTVLLLGLEMGLLAQSPQTTDTAGTQTLFRTNSSWVNGVAPGYWPTCTNKGALTSCSGLTLFIGPGTAMCGSGKVTYAGGTLAMSNNTTNYVKLDKTLGCIPSVSTTIFAGADAGLTIADVVTSGGAITAIHDDRTSFIEVAGGAGGFDPGFAPTSGGGLTLNIGPGNAFCSDGNVLGYPGGTLTMNNNSDNYIQFLPLNVACDNNAIQSNVTSFLLNVGFPIAKVITSGGAITSITDYRFWWVSPSLALPYGNKGSIVVGRGNGDVIEQTVGTNGQSPIADSTQTSGIRWGTVTATADLGFAPTAGAGLNLNVASGQAFCASNFQLNYAGGTFALTDNTDNYVYVSLGITSCDVFAVVASTFGGLDVWPIAKVTTAGGIITNISDVRTAAANTQYHYHAKGDLIVGDGSTPTLATRLPAGPNGDCLQSNTGASLGLSYGSCGGAPNPLTDLDVTDDFVTNTNGSTGPIGLFGGIAKSAIPNNISEAGHPGIFRMSVNASSTSNNKFLSPSEPSTLLVPSESFTMTWITRCTNCTNANDLVRFGISDDTAPGSGTTQPVNGVYVEHLTTDTNFFLVTRSASTQTRVDSGVGFDANFHKFVFTRVNGTTLGLTVDSASQVISNTNIPTAVMNYWSYIITISGSTRFLDTDMIRLQITGLGR